MKIYLMRHGQTTGDIEGIYGGDFDDHLTQVGKEQARQLGEKIKNFNIEKIFYSPRIRAKETTEIVNNILHIFIEEQENLKERNAYGILTGMSKKEAVIKYPKLVEELKNPKATIEGAEEYAGFKQRVLKVFSEITNNNFETIGIVTHGGVISCFMREVLFKERKKLSDCSIIELDFKNGSYVVVGLDGAEFE